MATNLVPLFDYREFFYRRSFAPIQQEEELNLVYFFLFKGIAESWEIITEVSASASESKFFCEVISVSTLLSSNDLVPLSFILQSGLH
ncbi:unnamed protein product [Rhizophagus irregularis]|nr:unnamed protein product [Rhizophagus irregularis]CAB5140593.1 unnamed protein product [Rhizophagus irregularis]CAB5358987.1 unnamed protein product [Rhizophagus irregularis]